MRGYAAAAELYRRVFQLDPRAVDAHIGLGMLHRAPGVPIRFDDALALFRKAAELDPSRADAHLNLASALLTSKDTIAARSELQTAKQLLSQASDTRGVRGVQALIDRIDRGEAITSSAYTLRSPRYRWAEQG